jgi:hypothetical protein
MADFVWGENGEKIPTSQTGSSARRRLAEALMQQGADYSPVKSWTQGLARMANGALGGYMANQEDQRDAASEAKTQQLLLANPLLGGGTPAAAATASPGVARVTQALTSAPAAADTTGKIYSNDEPSPMDPPSGADRINSIATLLGEEKPGSPEGLGVANVVRNRAVDGGYGGDTPSAVVQSPNQFSPWNDQSGRDRMARALQNPDAVAKASDQIDQAYGTGNTSRLVLRIQLREKLIFTIRHQWCRRMLCRLGRRARNTRRSAPRAFWTIRMTRQRNPPPLLGLPLPWARRRTRLFQPMPLRRRAMPFLARLYLLLPQRKPYRPKRRVIFAPC